MDGDGDSSPCRWAAMFHDKGSDSDPEFVDLTPHEQRSRGQELLKLLWEPLIPHEVVQPAPASEVQPQANMLFEHQRLTSNVNVRVKNTFIELVASSRGCGLKRSQSDSMLIHASIDNSTGPVVEFIDRNFSDIQLQHVVKPHVLNLSACLHKSHCHETADLLLDLSDASTNTPRESLEDASSSCEAFGTSFVGDPKLEDVADVFVPQSTGCSTYHHEEGYYYPYLGPACVSTQQGPEELAEVQAHHFALLGCGTFGNEDGCHCLPLDHRYMLMQQQQQFPCLSVSTDQACAPAHDSLSCPTADGNAWLSPWQFTIPLASLGGIPNSMDLQLPVAGMALTS